MFEVIDELVYEAFKGLSLSQVTKWKNNYWKCLTVDDFYMEVEIKLGIVKMKLAEVEYDLNNYDNEVLEIKLIDKNAPYFIEPEIRDIKFKDIMEEMNWTCEVEQIWDS